MRDLKIFTDNIEESALAQINELMSQPVFEDAKVRIMPDVHAGKGCVIGFTADLGDKVVPNLVGVDIGCGMLTVTLGDGYNECDLSSLDAFIRERIPSGHNVHDTTDPVVDQYFIDKLRCRPYLKNLDHIRKSLGTLGGGNHFIEIDKDELGNQYLIIHSGSRNLGKQVAEYYQNLAIEKLCHRDKESVDKLIAEYKATGREKEISGALKALKSATPPVPKHLAYLEGKDREDYLHDMRICQQFAEFNRHDIASNILGVDPAYYGCFSTVHNYIDFDDKIVRKGAISAQHGQTVLIPLNMRDGCILGAGKGNPDWNCSAPHGAGRIMSRAEAKRSVSLEDFKESMCGIYTTSVDESTIDESPFAYKAPEEIIDKIRETVNIIKVLKPIYNFKASEV